MALTDIMIKKTKPQDKVFFLSDGRGLMLEVRPSGGKSWIARLRLNGKEKRKVIGQYPDVSIAEAREECLKLKKQAKTGSLASTSENLSFLDVYNEWFRIKAVSTSESHIKKVAIRMNKHVLPFIGEMPISTIKSADILTLCRKLEIISAYTARLMCQLIGQVFRFAIAASYVETDPTYALRGALATHKEKHYATITEPSKIALLIRAINAYPYNIVRLALQFSVLTIARPGEVRHAEWSEIDFEKAEWRIPAEKMKMKRVHIVPLSSQLLQILQELKTLTGSQKWLFPSARNDSSPISENTVRIALRTMGYSNEDITPHGFRGMASTVFNENGWSSDHIEFQLAHAEKNKIRAAYNHAQYLPQRREMMQWYADYLDSLK